MSGGKEELYSYLFKKVQNFPMKMSSQPYSITIKLYMLFYLIVGTTFSVIRPLVGDKLLVYKHCCVIVSFRYGFVYDVLRKIVIAEMLQTYNDFL